MRTRQTILCALIMITLAFAACEQPINPSKVTLTSITAVYNGTAAIYPDTPLKDLKEDLTVKAQYSNKTSKTLNAADYALSGTLAVGERNITVTYEGKKTTFTVTVTAAPTPDITYTVTQTGGTDNVADSTGIVFIFNASVDSLNLTAADITVGGTAVKGSGALTGSETSRTLPITVTTAGTATVTITKTGIEAETKNVTVYKAEQTTTGTEGLSYELINNGTAYRVRAGSVTSGAVIIPANFNGKPVTEIGANNENFLSGAFPFTSITSITIPASVTSIGEMAFSGCTSLTTVNFATGSQLQTIGDMAFFGCTSLTSITVPANVMEIDSGTFQDCTSLANITVDPSNPNYASEDGILYNKTKTILYDYPSASGNITIPASVTSIGSGAFYKCIGLTEITIPNSVTAIGSFAFSDCTSLTSITIPNSVTAIGSRAFSQWTASQTIYVEGHEDQTAADSAWGENWRNGCNAVISYNGQ